MKRALAVAAMFALGTAFGQPVESLRVRVVNAPGGRIEASADGGATWTRLGSVTVPADRVNPASYTAAGWARDSHIAATATNALHIKVANHPQTGRPMTLSLVPAGPIVGAANRQRSSAIHTDIPGGTAIFGGGLGPYVNSPVFLEPAHAPLPPEYQPREGDVLLIVRFEPVRRPRLAVFENRAGGNVTVDYGNGPESVGVVDRPVTGIGRFEGGLTCWPGRVRANHPGVIDVSTAPHGMVGGFQIIPRGHAQSPEMAYALSGHQWMIVGMSVGGSREGSVPDSAGQPPFFAETVLPSYRTDDIVGDHADWVQRVWSRTLVQVRVGDGEWEPMPRIAFAAVGSRRAARASHAALQTQRGRAGLWLIPQGPKDNKALQQATRDAADHALEGVTAFRLVFPLTTFPPPDRRSP